MRDVRVLLVELSTALQRQGMYPAGHPALEPAADAVARSAARLLRDREHVAFGVTRSQLIVDGVATDARQPVLRRLAERLHRHHLAAVSVSRGVDAAEVQEALGVLATDPDRDGPIGLRPREDLPTWPHLHLHPLTFERLTLSTDGEMGGEGAAGGAPANDLWVGLTRAAMESTDAAAASAGAIDPDVIAGAIEARFGTDAYDQAIVGYLLEIANALKDATGEGATTLRRRSDQLVAELRPETLRRLVAMIGSAAKRSAFVRDAARGMAVGAVLEIVRAAADTNEETISHGLIRMLSKLSAQAEHGSGLARPLADAALREQVARLLSEWTLEDPNPAEYGGLLAHLATSSASTGRYDAGADTDRPEPLRIVQMCLEAGASGPLLDHAVDRAVLDGTTAAVLDVLTQSGDERDAVPAAIRARLADPASVRTLLALDPVDFDSLDRVLPALDTDGCAVLIDALAASDDRLTRRRLMDRLARVDRDISDLVAEHLKDERWFVQRNMLALLEQTGRVPSTFSASRWTAHADPRVRLQAVRLQLTLPHERERALRTALSSADPRLIRVALGALRSECPASILPLVANIARSTDADEDLQVLAVRALGHSRARLGMDTLIGLVRAGRTLLGRPRLAPANPVRLAALKVLATAWADDPGVAPILDLARQSTSADVRAAARATPPPS
jgi:hypothetical protein